MLDDFLVRAGLAGLGLCLATGPLGSFVVWRRMAYFGDATAHAAILGVALALATDLPVYAGTLAVALAMALTVASLTGRGQSSDTMLGVLAHSALALGLVAVSFLHSVRVDLSAFLFGDILAVTRADLVWVWGGSLAVLALLAWRWQALVTATVSEDLAQAAGLNPGRERLVLTVALALVVAVAIKIVGRAADRGDADRASRCRAVGGADARGDGAGRDAGRDGGGDRGAGRVAAVGHACGAVDRGRGGGAVRGQPGGRAGERVEFRLRRGYLHLTGKARGSAMNHLWDGLFGRHEGSRRDFLILPDGGRVTYAAFLEQAAGFAGALAAAGLRPGDRVALLLEKSPAMLALIAGAVRAGVVFLPLNPAYTAAEVSYFIADAGAKLLVCDGAREAELRPVAEAAGALLATLSADRSGSFAEMAGDAGPVVARGRDDIAALLYTSGTTGRSKGAMLTQGNLLSNAVALTEVWGFTDRDVLLHALPVFHTHGLFVATNVALIAGCPMIFLPKFDAGEVLRLMPQATAMMGVPTFYVRLLGEAGLTKATVDHMRLFVSGSAPLLAETHREWEARTGHRILERYGMTETNMNTSNPLRGDRRAGTVGMALPGVEVRVCDDAGAELARGETGMVEVRGPNVFKGYWGMPEKTAAELRGDGFFITGDLGVMDEDGYLTIVGRGKDLIISGGFNVYPKEVEMAIDALPGVVESAVVGVPHADFGEGVVAVSWAR